MIHSYNQALLFLALMNIQLCAAGNRADAIVLKVRIRAGSRQRAQIRFQERKDSFRRHITHEEEMESFGIAKFRLINIQCAIQMKRGKIFRFRNG